jgi:hypothetical protein
MTSLQLFFWLTSISCLLLALSYGAREEKIGMIIIFTGSLVTTILAFIGHLDVARMAVWFLAADAVVLAALIRLSFSSRKYWPVWVGSLQMITVVIHVLELLLPRTVPVAYAILQGFWVYPMMIAIMGGTLGSRVLWKRNASRNSAS